MGFDLTTAKPVESGGFDLSTAKPIDPNNDRRAAKPPMADVVRNAMFGGAAAIPDMLLNTPNNIMNLGKAAYGALQPTQEQIDALKKSGAYGSGAVPTAPQNLPQITPNTPYVENLMSKIGIIKEGVVPQGTTQKAADILTRGAVGGALTGGGGLASIAGAGMGALSAGSAGTVAAMGGSPAAQVVAGMVAPAAVAKIPSVVSSAAPHLMQSALKPTLKNLTNGNAARAIQTMLDEGINVSAGGVQKLKDQISILNGEIAREIAKSPAIINKQAVYSPLKQTLDRFSNQVNPNADVTKIKSAWDEFINHPLINGQGIPIQLAQELKQGTYSILNKKYGEVGSAETEAQKAIARGLKEEIAKAAPEVSGLNARESALINALKIAERRSLMEGNKNPFGLSSLASHKLGFGAFLADRSALVKSLLARGAHSTNDYGILSKVSNQTSPIVTQGILSQLLNEERQ